MFRCSAAAPRRCVMPDLARAKRADLSNVARRATAGDPNAWADLVTRLDGLLRAVAKGYRLGAADVDDVVQTTWLRAVEHIGTLNNPAAISGWLVVTLRREAMRTLQRRVREVLVDDPEPVEDVDAMTPERIAIERERDAALRDAVARLSDRQRQVVESMMLSGPVAYRQLATQLDMPIGSIGPTRDRALTRLGADDRLVRVVD
jgi:RNA polymerase sigma factor (sigma-70 family)